MQTAANNNLVLTNVSSFTRFADSLRIVSHGGFYQLIASELIISVHTGRALLALGDRLVVLAERAHAFRRMDSLGCLSQILVSLPLPSQYAAVGSYDQAVCPHNFGRGDVQHASSLLERVVEKAPTRYRVRAIISLSLIHI